MADDFQTGAELEVKVTESSLRSARRTIEEELGDIEVEVTASVAGGGSGGAVGHRGPESPLVDLNRRQLREFELMRGEEFETMIELLRSIDDDLGQGGGGGGGGLLKGGLLLRAGQMTAGGGGGLFGGALLGGMFGGAGSAGLAVGGASLGAGLLVKELLGLEATGGKSPATREVKITNWPDWLKTDPESTSGKSPATRDPELKLPQEWPPELKLPKVWPPKLDVPEDITLPFDEGPAFEVGGNAVDLRALGGDPSGEGALEWTNLLGAPSGGEGRRKFMEVVNQMMQDRNRPAGGESRREFAQQEFSTSVDVTQNVEVEGSMQEAVDKARKESQNEVDDAIDSLIDAINRQTGLNLSL